MLPTLVSAGDGDGEVRSDLDAAGRPRPAPRDRLVASRLWRGALSELVRAPTPTAPAEKVGETRAECGDLASVR